ncbi:MAG TPA: hypothetical protein VNN22_23190 [Verrucomicrobiae bacterium]|nr:hypothetical protein [Verrucomicrobiae bacterium]
MTLMFNKNDGFARFVSCVKRRGLLLILSQAARCVTNSRTHPVFPDGFKFTDGFKTPPTRRNNLTRGGIFRGKVPQRTNQNNVNRLEERTLPAPN